jgi:hypothetical protein
LSSCQRSPASSVNRTRAFWPKPGGCNIKNPAIPPPRRTLHHSPAATLSFGQRPVTTNNIQGVRTSGTLGPVSSGYPANVCGRPTGLSQLHFASLHRKGNHPVVLFRDNFTFKIADRAVRGVDHLDEGSLSVPSAPCQVNSLGLSTEPRLLQRRAALQFPSNDPLLLTELGKCDPPTDPSDDQGSPRRRIAPVDTRHS